MPTFTVRDGHFWLDDEPQLIHAAEFHYFRTPRDQWVQRLGLLQDAGFNTLATYIPWLWHQLEEGESDLDGHGHPLRDLAGFLDLAAEMGFLLIPRPGPYIMAETINEGIPPWVFEKYPQVALINQKEEAQNIVSYLHPDFLKCVEGWFKEVFAVLTPRQVTRGGRAIMIQLDNEMGMPHWVRNMFDVNPDTLERLAAWLRKRYGDALAERYPADELPAFLRDALVHPSEPYAAAVVDDYRHFYRDYLREYMDFLWTTARAEGMEVPPIVNIHGFTNHRGGRTFPIGLSQLVEVMEMPGMVSATDVYPIHIDEGNLHELLFVNESTKALQNPEQALFSVEFQSGGNNDFSGAQSSLYDLHSRLCLSVGMRAINHYLFTAGENDPILSPIRRHDWGPPIRNDGTTRSHYPRYGRLSRVLNSYGAALTLAQPRTVTTIGFLIDHFMTEVDNDLTKAASGFIAHQRDDILFDFLARGLAITQRPFDAVELARAELDPAQRPHLWVMMDKQCPDEVQRKLLDYARSGGTLVLVGRIPEVAPDGAPATRLRDALGIERVKSDRPFRGDTVISALDVSYIPASFVESYEGRFDEIIARRVAPSGPGEIVGFVKALGKGRILLIGASFNAFAPDDLALFGQLARKVGVEPLFELSEWADVRISHGEAGSFLFINHYRDDPISTVIRYEGATLFGGNPVTLPARRGLILPLDWKIRDGVMLHFATGEVAGVEEDGERLTLTLVPGDAIAEFALDGYRCEGATEAGDGRVRAVARDGRIVLTREG